MADRYTAETAPYKTPAKMGQYQEDTGSFKGKPQRASYTPVGGPASTATAASYGKSGPRAAALGSVPGQVVAGASEVAPLPAMPGTLRIGEDKNVSTPVTGG